MTTELYYTAPSEDVFNEVKAVSMELWREIDTDNDKYGYASEKINRIKDLRNVEDNIMSIVAMFDLKNHRKLASKLSEEARQAIRERMEDGGHPIYLIEF